MTQNPTPTMKNKIKDAIVRRFTRYTTGKCSSILDTEIGMLQDIDYLLPDGYVEEWKSEPVPTPFNEALVLLQELYDLQNGAPLERYKEQWAETMAKIDYFLSKWPTLPQPPKTKKP